MTDYSLHVDILVDANDVSDFEALTGEFLRQNSFRRFNPTFDYELVMAFRTEKPFALGSQTPSSAEAVANDRQDRRLKAGGPVFRFVHLWTVPTTADLDLISVMTRSADDGLYRKIDALVLSETQEFVAQAPGTIKPGTPPTPIKDQTFVRVTRQFASAELGSYVFAMGVSAHMAPAVQNAKPQWYSRGAFLAITGTLSTVTEFWQEINPVGPGANAIDPFDAGLVNLDAASRARLAVGDVASRAQRKEAFVKARYWP